jgi:AcrR family transcriptional regulator
VDRILEAARELLRETPDQSLTVERIAARADVSQPTVFNLVGPREKIWAALADASLERLDLDGLRVVEEPQERARAIVDAVLGMVCDDAPVFRALLANWKQSARVIHHDPTDALAGCLAACEGLDARRTAQLVSAGLIGLVHQWSAALITDAEAHQRGRALVDLAFLAGRAQTLGGASTTRPAAHPTTPTADTVPEEIRP